MLKWIIGFALILAGIGGCFVGAVSTDRQTGPALVVGGLVVFGIGALLTASNRK